MSADDLLREHLARLLGWEDAHVSYDTAVAGIPAGLRGTRPPPLSYSAWELLEHLRITQHDILDFCRNPAYRERAWPDEYWPSPAGPLSRAAWNESIRRYRGDRKALQQLAADPAVDLAGRIPHGTGQTYLRELLLVADHSAYHIGQLVMLRRLLGIWTS